MLQPGTILEIRYKVEKIIDHDEENGSVYMGIHLNLKKQIIIKEINAREMVEHTRQMVTPVFMQKSRTFAKFEHPSIPKIIDFFPANNMFYLVMDFLEGKTIDSSMKLRNSRPFGEKNIIKYGIGLCKVLWFLHNQQPSPVILGNLSPKNVMIDPDGNIILLNLSISRYLLGSTHACKPGYTAPEAYRSQFLPESDVFSAGNILYYMATGIDPGMSQSTNYGLPSVRTTNPEISFDFEEIINKAMEVEVRDRYNNMKEMKKALENCFELPEFKPPPPVEDTPYKAANMGSFKTSNIRASNKFKIDVESAIDGCLSSGNLFKRSTGKDKIVKSSDDEPVYEFSKNVDVDPFEILDKRRRKEKDKIKMKQKAAYEAVDKFYEIQRKSKNIKLMKYAIPIALGIAILISIIIYVILNR